MGTKVFSSAVNFNAVTPSDSTIVTCMALYIGGSGNIAIAPSQAGSAVTFSNVGAGTILPVSLKEGRVMSTNTTATNIVALSW